MEIGIVQYGGLVKYKFPWNFGMFLMNYCQGSHSCHTFSSLNGLSLINLLIVFLENDLPRSPNFSKPAQLHIIVELCIRICGKCQIEHLSKAPIKYQDTKVGYLTRYILTPFIIAYRPIHFYCTYWSVAPTLLPYQHHGTNSSVTRDSLQNPHVPLQNILCVMHALN